MLSLGRLVVAVTLLLGAAACRDRQDVAENVAEVSFGERNATLEVSSCGLDEEQQVLVLAASSSDLFLQLLLAVTGEGDEDREIDPAASGLTLEVAREGVLGAGAAALIGAPVGTAGTIESARIRGDRIDVQATAEVLPSSVGEDLEPMTIDVAARCSEIDDVALGST